MNYYAEKYTRVSIEEDTYENFVSSVDFVFKDSKVYRVQNDSYQIYDENELRELIDYLCIDKEFVLKSSSNDGFTILQDPKSLNYACINTKTDEEDKYWVVEIVTPQVVSNY
jgi:hypothetical protein